MFCGGSAVEMVGIVPSAGGKARGNHHPHGVRDRDMRDVLHGLGGQERQELPPGFPNREGVRH